MAKECQAKRSEADESDAIKPFISPDPPVFLPSIFLPPHNFARRPCGPCRRTHENIGVEKGTHASRGPTTNMFHGFIDGGVDFLIGNAARANVLIDDRPSLLNPLRRLPPSFLVGHLAGSQQHDANLLVVLKGLAQGNFQPTPLVVLDFGDIADGHGSHTSSIRHPSAAGQSARVARALFMRL